MAINTLIKFIFRNPVSLILRMNKTLNEFYRAGYISTAISEGIYDLLSEQLFGRYKIASQSSTLYAQKIKYRLIPGIW
jgi:hypothetical protein